MIYSIVAKAANDVIGKDNALIWHLPADLQHFKRLTTGHIIVMGRKTLESLPKLLPNREHWVVTRQADYVPPYEGVRVFHSIDEVVKAAATAGDVFCIGGAQFYAAMMPYVDMLYVTELVEAFDGDAVFPAITADFQEVERVEGVLDEKNTIPHAFVTYVRKGSKA